jgi:hypothetical protein
MQDRGCGPSIAEVARYATTSGRSRGRKQVLTAEGAIAFHVRQHNVGAMPDQLGQYGFVAAAQRELQSSKTGGLHAHRSMMRYDVAGRATATGMMRDITTAPHRTIKGARCRYASHYIHRRTLSHAATSEPQHHPRRAATMRGKRCATACEISDGKTQLHASELGGREPLTQVSSGDGASAPPSSSRRTKSSSRRRAAASSTVPVR